MNTPKIEVHQYDGVKSSLHTGKLLPGERGYAGGESATPRTDDAQILASFNEVEPPHYPRAFLAVTADFARQLERETATLHAQLGEARAEGERRAIAEFQIGELKYCSALKERDEARAQIARMKGALEYIAALHASRDTLLQEMTNDKARAVLASLGDTPAGQGRGK